MTGDLRTRLARLERAAFATLPCAGCLALSARFVVQFPHQPPPPELSGEHCVRCSICGRERMGDTVVMRVVGPKQMKDFHEATAA
jgi:hypothetical protein